VDPRGEVTILDPTGTRTPTSRSCSPWPVAVPNWLPRDTVQEVAYSLGVVCARKYVRTEKGHCCRLSPVEAQAIFFRVPVQVV
jgi:hypothetical protein